MRNYVRGLDTDSVKNYVHSLDAENVKQYVRSLDTETMTHAIKGLKPEHADVVKNVVRGELEFYSHSER